MNSKTVSLLVILVRCALLLALLLGGIVLFAKKEESGIGIPEFLVGLGSAVLGSLVEFLSACLLTTDSSFR